MEKNEIIMDEDPEIKSLNDQELFIYRYLNEENKSKIKSELNSEISHLEKIEEPVSDIEDNKEKEINEKIQNYFNSKNKSNKELNILYTVDDLQKEKITLEKNIKEKKEDKDLFKLIEMNYRCILNNYNSLLDSMERILNKEILDII